MAQSNLSRLLELSGSSGKMEPDESGFYVRFIPSDDEKARIEKYLSEQLDSAQANHLPIFKEAAENIKAYRAVKTRYSDDDKDEILPLPLCAIAADQIIARTYNTLVQPRPMVSFDPYFSDKYEVTVPVDMAAQGPDGQPVQTTVPVPTPVESEEIARRFEQGFEFKARERFNLPKAVREVVGDVVKVGKAYIKVCADRTTRTAFAPEVDNVVDLQSAKEIKLRNPEVARIYTLSVFNVLRLEDGDSGDPQYAEKTPISPDIFLSRVKSGEYNLITEEEAEKLSQIVSEIKTDFEKDVRSSAYNKQDDNPKKAIDLYEIQFDWIVKAKDPDTGETTTKIIPLQGDWHDGANRLCSLYRNPYDHQERTITPCWQNQDEHDDTGSCTVGRLKWHQRAATAAIQADFKNSFHANNFAYWYVPGSPAEDYFAGGRVLRSGEACEGKFNEDWGIVRVGAAHESMLPLVQWTEGSGERVSDESAYKQGQSIPGRTAAATVSQIIQQGLQQPLMFIRTLNDSFSRVIRLYLKTARQFQPFGETIPITDPATKEIIEIPFRYPIAQEGVDPLDNFRIALTASDEALAKEHEPEQIQMFMNAAQQYWNFVAQVAGPMANPQASPATTQLFQKILTGADAIFKKFVGIYRTDEDNFDIKTSIDALVKEREQAAEAMAKNPPPPPQPEVKISLSGQLTPPEVDAAAQSQGIGGQVANPNAGTPMGSGGAAGMGAGQGMAQQPGNAPAPQPPTGQGIPPH